MAYDKHKNFYSGTPQKVAPAGKRRKKRRSVLAILLTVALALTSLLLAAATTGYFLITHRPADYQPRQWSADPEIRKQEQKQANRWADEKVQELNQGTQFNAQEEKSFVFRIEQNKLNDLLMTDDVQNRIKWNWPDFERHFHQIQFSFNDGKIMIMGEVKYKDVGTILTIVFALQLLDNGDLNIKLSSVEAGALPLPKMVINEQLDRITKIINSKQTHIINNKMNRKEESKDVEEFLNLLAGLLQNLIDKRNMTVPAEFPVDVDKKARILALDIDEGYVDLTLKPFWVDE